MNLYSPWLWAPLLALAGGIVGYILRQLVAYYRKDTAELSVKKLLLDAKGEAQKTLEEAKKKSEGGLEEFRGSQARNQGARRTAKKTGGENTRQGRVS